MNILQIITDAGVSNAEEIPIDKLIFQPELRAYCEQNACGRYARNYTCPPFIGEIDDLISKIKSFDWAVIWQNIYELEDSFDFEGMMDAQAKHNAQTIDIAKRVTAEHGNALVLAAGGCTLCEKCAAQTGELCRDRDNAISSLEAYGINVSKICESTSMKYINGVNTVTYFSGVFYKQ
ncbi:MAG: DUF2284 domain-containing protein [Oscillospiraceae bacterium]|nr:DUF2284 domain-containing protein [Oscillospiraceae bacterium]